MDKTQLTPKILTVDDKSQNLYALKKTLAKLDAEIYQVTTGFEALSLTLQHDFCLAIVDVQMPEMDGYELVELLRSNARTANLPVIFVSAIFSSEYHHRKGYDAGVVDFLNKPFVPEILLSKVNVFLDLYHQRVKLEEKNEALEREIEQRQQAETSLRQANTRLSDLNADKDKLFSIISHDLRSPFQTLLGNTELMVELLDHLSKTDIQDMADSIYRSAKTAFNLLDNLLTWSRLQQGRIQYDPSSVSLNELVENTIALLNDKAHSKHIELGHTIESGLAVYVDEYMVDTVIRNLTSNALKFTPAGGRVTLSVHRNGHNSEDPEREWVEVMVTDTGVGISEEDINKLFRSDVHHTTTGTAKETGTGLGLVLCQEMVAKNGGRIWVESEENKGTTVIFTVPVTNYTCSESGEEAPGL